MLLPTKSYQKRARQKPTLPTVAVILIPVVLVIALIIGAVAIAGSRDSAPENSDSTESGVNIADLLSGIDSRPPTAPAGSASGTTAPPETTVPRPAVTYDECRQRMDSLRTFFFDNVYSNDSEARYANVIQLRQTYYSENSRDPDNTYIAFLYLNATGNYYKVLYLPANSFSVDGETLVSHTTYMTQCASGSNQLEAMSKCWFLSSTLYINSVL